MKKQTSGKFSWTFTHRLLMAIIQQCQTCLSLIVKLSPFSWTTPSAAKQQQQHPSYYQSHSIIWMPNSYQETLQRLDIMSRWKVFTKLAWHKFDGIFETDSIKGLPQRIIGVLTFWIQIVPISINHHLVKSNSATCSKLDIYHDNHTWWNLPRGEQVVKLSNVGTVIAKFGKIALRANGSMLTSPNSDLSAERQG